MDSAGKAVLYPDLSNRDEVTSLEYLNSCIGVNLGINDVVGLLKRMSLQTKAINDGKDVLVSVPPTRSDIHLKISFHAYPQSRSRSLTYIYISCMLVTSWKMWRLPMATTT